MNPKSSFKPKLRLSFRFKGNSSFSKPCLKLNTIVTSLFVLNAILRLKHGLRLSFFWEDSDPMCMYVFLVSNRKGWSNGGEEVTYQHRRQWGSSSGDFSTWIVRCKCYLMSGATCVYVEHWNVTQWDGYYFSRWTWVSRYHNISVLLYIWAKCQSTERMNLTAHLVSMYCTVNIYHMFV